MTAKNFKVGKRRKKKGNILPFLVFVIIAYLAYSANPEYWHQGKLVQDFLNGGAKKESTEDIANIPDTPPEEYEPEPEIDPDASVAGSVKGAKTIPANVLKSVSSNDPMYYAFASRAKYIYFVMPNTQDSRELVAATNDEIKANGLKAKYVAAGMLYDSSNKKADCSKAATVEFFCKVCDRKACLVNARKGEYIPLQPTTSHVIAKIKQIEQQEW